MPPCFSHWFIMSMLNHKQQMQAKKFHTQTNKTVTITPKQ